MRVLSPKLQLLHLDAIDWKILFEVKDNIRQPLTKVAETCLLSRQAVEYRLKQMALNNLITGSRAVINTRLLGYKSYHVLIETQSPEDEKELVNRAQKNDSINLIILYSGKYNLEISLLAKDEEDFIHKYIHLVNGLRIRKDMFLTLRSTLVGRVLPEQFMHLKKKTEMKVIEPSSKSKEVKFDMQDLQLMYRLSQEATRTNTSLAEELKLSKDTVKYRIKQLEESGLIREYRPVINYSALGLSVNTLLLRVDYRMEEVQKLEMFLKSNLSILWCAKALGYYDYMIYVITRNLDEFHELISQIKEKFSDLVKTYEVLFAHEELKYEFMSKSIVKEFGK